jgi:hypothetical protein
MKGRVYRVDLLVPIPVLFINYHLLGRKKHFLKKKLEIFVRTYSNDANESRGILRSISAFLFNIQCP